MSFPPQGPPSGQPWPYPPDPQPWPEADGPPPRRNKLLYAALALAVVVILVLSGVVIGQMAGGDSDAPSPTAAPQPTAQQPQQSQPSATFPQPTGGALPSMTCDGYTVQLDATSPPGWKPTIGQRGLAYAAPPEWDVKACGVQLGWQKPCPDGQPGVCAIRAMSAASTLPNPACGENATLAMAGVAGSNLADINAALDEEARTVPLIYSSPDGGQTPVVTLAPVRQFTIGSAPAVQTVATVTGIAAGECTSPGALHSMVATTVPNVEGAVVFIISLRQGVAGAPDPNVINEMVATLRGAG